MWFRRVGIRPRHLQKARARTFKRAGVIAARAVQVFELIRTPTIGENGLKHRAGRGREGSGSYCRSAGGDSAKQEDDSSSCQNSFHRTMVSETAIPSK